MRFARSRLATIEEKKNMKRVYIYVSLSIVAIVIFIFLGIPILTNLTGFIGEIKKTNQPVEKEDITPPAPPQVDDLPVATNKDKLEIKGSSEAGANIKLFINDSNETVVADKNGKFSFTTSLVKGENKISLLSRDDAGNESTSTPEYIVTYDNKDPELEVTSPPDGQSYYGSLQRQVVIEGKTEDGASITINDRMVVVESDGSFAYATSLQEGDNNFNIKASDNAGNETTKGITLHYWK
jgi:hypothetical protein